MSEGKDLSDFERSVVAIATFAGVSLLETASPAGVLMDCSVWGAQRNDSSSNKHPASGTSAVRIIRLIVKASGV